MESALFIYNLLDLFEDKLYIQTGLVKDVAKQMIQNPKVEISAMYKHGDGNTAAKTITFSSSTHLEVSF